MNIQQLRDQFEAELRRQRLPQAYIQRLLEEWDDHLADLQDERNRRMADARNSESSAPDSQSADIISLESRLGDPIQLAAVAAKHYHNRSFLGRHPVLTFLILPYPLALGFLVFLGVLLTGVGMAMNAWLGDSASDLAIEQHPLGENIGCVCLAWIFIVLPPLCSALLLCRIARRNALDWRWALAGCAIVALFAGQFRIVWRLSTLPHTGLLMIGLGFAPLSAAWVFSDFLPRLTFAMTVGWLLVKRAQRLQRIDQSHPENTLVRQAA